MSSALLRNSELTEYLNRQIKKKKQNQVEEWVLQRHKSTIYEKLKVYRRERERESRQTI